MMFVKNAIRRYLGTEGLKGRIDTVVKEVVEKEIKDQTYAVARGLANGKVPWAYGSTRELSTVLHKLVKDRTNGLAAEKVAALVAEAIEETGLNTEEFIDGIVVRLKAKQLG